MRPPYPASVIQAAREVIAWSRAHEADFSERFRAEAVIGRILHAKGEVDYLARLLEAAAREAGNPPPPMDDAVARDVEKDVRRAIQSTKIMADLKGGVS